MATIGRKAEGGRRKECCVIPNEVEEPVGLSKETPERSGGVVLSFRLPPSRLAIGFYAIRL